MRLETGYEGRAPRLEMVALMDVIFLLLASFVYATFTMTPVQGLDVDLPHGVGSEADDQIILITLNRDGTLELQGESVSPDLMAAAVLARDPEHLRQVVLRGDTRAALGTAVELLSTLNQAGITRVSFQIEERP